MTLLADGTVLATGTVGDRADPSAELYDPDTRSWTTTGSTLGRHDGAPATQLLDGTVLVAGGGTDTAELYVPAGEVATSRAARRPGTDEPATDRRLGRHWLDGHASRWPHRGAAA